MEILIPVIIVGSIILVLRGIQAYLFYKADKNEEAQKQRILARLAELEKSCGPNGEPTWNSEEQAEEQAEEKAETESEKSV